MEKQQIEKVKLSQIDRKNLNWKTIIGLYLNYKEVIHYLFFGGLATIVNFVSYFVFARFIGIDEVISSGLLDRTNLQWYLVIIFFMEMISFFLARIASGILCDVGTFALMVKVFHINDIFSKIITQIMVVIVNYFFSKLIVFRKKKEIQ